MQSPDPHQNPKNNIAQDVLIFNMKQLELFNIVIYMTAGVIAGILGLTGMNGLYLLILVSLISSGGLLFRMKFDSEQYTSQSIVNLTFSGLTGQALTYILFWTFAYALVHIY